jgi:outer membrane protein OmpA-like peptidoglycan-associated protein
VTTCARREALASQRVIFSGDSAELLRPARITMRRMIAQLREACAVTIAGHAADAGDPNGDVAQNLSARRAQVVAAFLRARGIDITDIDAFGKTQPISPERALNRRVEITWHLPR